MQELIYMKDCYVREFDANVIEVIDGKAIVLDRTAFYPQSGGQPHDTGVIICKGQEYKVTCVSKSNGLVIIGTDRGGLEAGDCVRCSMDWERRHRLMRYHTASHVLSGVIFKETGAHITGNQLSLDMSRIDFDLERFDRDRIKEYEERANGIIAKNKTVRIRFLSREEAIEDETIFRLAKELPETITEFRIVEIEGFDRQACAGCHVSSTGEIGRITILRAENKGKSNRRIYFEIP